MPPEAPVLLAIYRYEGTEFRKRCIDWYQRIRC